MVGAAARGLDYSSFDSRDALHRLREYSLCEYEMLQRNVAASQAALTVAAACAATGRVDVAAVLQSLTTVEEELHANLFPWLGTGTGVSQEDLRSEAEIMKAAEKRILGDNPAETIKRMASEMRERLGMNKDTRPVVPESVIAERSRSWQDWSSHNE